MYAVLGHSEEDEEASPFSTMKSARGKEESKEKASHNNSFGHKASILQPCEVSMGSSAWNTCHYIGTCRQPFQGCCAWLRGRGASAGAGHWLGDHARVHIHLYFTHTHIYIYI